MSIEAYQAAWKISGLNSGQKLALLAIADFASVHNGYTCEASIKTLAEMVDVSQRQMKRILAALEDAEIVRVSANVGRGNTNRYSIQHIVKGDTDVTNNSIKGDTGVTISKPEKVTSSTEKVTPVSVKGDTHVTQTVYNPNKPYFISPPKGPPHLREYIPEPDPITYALQVEFPTLNGSTPAMAQTAERLGVSGDAIREHAKPLLEAFRDTAMMPGTAKAVEAVLLCISEGITAGDIIGAKKAIKERWKKERPWPSQIIGNFDQLRGRAQGSKHNELPAVVGEF